MTDVIEHQLIARLAAAMPRGPHQINRIHESDAELVRLPGSGTVLAVTTDGVVEEIASGLYDDPYLAGWMTVTVNASDLAAVGADPLGIVISEALPPDMPPERLADLQRGIGDAARAHAIPVLGGDTNASPSLQLTATALGLVPADAVLTRRGARPGDRLFASGGLGAGTAFAFDRLLRTDRSHAVPFRPTARLREGRRLLRWASACMDTSDGAIATLDELMRLNQVGMAAEFAWEDVLDPAALATARAAGLPPWTMLAGPHGEFELLFTVPGDRREAFLADAASADWYPVELGRVVPSGGFSCRVAGETLRFDTTRIRNLFAASGGDARAYMTALLTSAAPEASQPA